MSRLLGSLLLFSLTLYASDVTGKWTAKVPMRDGPVDIVMEMKSDGERVTGTISSSEGTTDILDGKLAGDQLTFAVESDTARFLVQGKVAGGEIRFTARRQGSESEQAMEFTAAKTP